MARAWDLRFGDGGGCCRGTACRALLSGFEVWDCTGDPPVARFGDNFNNNTMIHTLSDITAVILAGGAGTRLRGTLPGIPKVLADINGRPFISILLDRLEQFGIRRVILCTGSLGHLIKDALGDRYGNVRLEYSHESTPLDTAGALANARHLLPEGPALVINGDSYCHTDLNQFYAWFKEKAADAAILLTHVADTRRYGKVELDVAGYVVSFNEKTDKSGPGLINAGIYLIDRAIIEALPENTPCSLEKGIFPGLAGGKLMGFSTQDDFIDIGTPESYQKAADFFTTLKGLL